jgi:hypothetical protein
MAAEYCDLQWDEAASPYVKVGTLTFPATPQADLSQDFPVVAAPVQRLEHAALDGPPRADLPRQKHAHKAHAEMRLTHLYATQPGAMVGKAPF